MMRRKNSTVFKIFLAAGTVLIFVWTLFPVVWMLSTSFKTPTAVFDKPPELIPRSPTISSYKKMVSGTVGVTPISRFFGNSVITSISTVAVATIFAILASFALSRLRFKLRGPVMLGILVTQMFPLVVLLTPLYILYMRLRLINTYLGLVIAFTSFTLPFSIWMLKGFVDTIPTELDEAAIIDGCGSFGVLGRIIVPLIRPGIMATAVFAFLDAWNNLLFPLTLVTDVSMKTLPPGMILAFGGEFKHDWSGMMATSALVALPVIAVFVILQRYLVEGLTAGSVKG
jgi:multiple sugar transport system permease protein